MQSLSFIFLAFVSSLNACLEADVAQLARAADL